MSLLAFRLAVILFFLFILFLPFHFHPVTFHSELGQECACVHGTLTQAGLAAAAPALVPPVNVSLVFPNSDAADSRFLVESEFARAPPLFL